MPTKPKKIAALKAAQRITKPPANNRGSYITEVQNEAVKQLVKALHIKNCERFSVKDYRRAIESFIKKEIGYGTALNLLIKVGIRVRKRQKNPAKYRKLKTRNGKGE